VNGDADERDRDFVMEMQVGDSEKFFWKREGEKFLDFFAPGTERWVVMMHFGYIDRWIDRLID
jgi:hypothetical protein